MLSNREIEEKVQNFFMPNICKAEIYECNAKLKFKVFSVRGRNVELGDLPLSHYRNETKLERVLEQIKERVG